MADTKMNDQSTAEEEQELSPRNRRIIAWIDAQQAEVPTEEDMAWADRFRKFIAENRFSLTGGQDK